MNGAIINEQLIDQTNHSPEDGISLGTKILSVTIRCTSDSANNVWVGWNRPANNSNILQPSESVNYSDDRVLLDNNTLYIQFDPTGTGGKALVSIITDTEEEIC